MRQAPKYEPRLENVEVELLLEGIHLLHGLNLEEHSGAPVRRKIWEAIRREKVRTISALQERLLHDSDAMQRFLQSVLPPVPPLTAEFFLKFRRELVPILKTYPFIRIWQVGCGSVYETYTLAIVLLEEGVYDKSLVYGTDIHECNIQRCQDGVFPLAGLDRYAKLYARSGGRGNFSDYVSGGGQSGVFDRSLKKHLVFSRHNLANDGSFNEFNLILCRSPLGLYNRWAQEQAHRLLYESLVMFGLLCLNRGELIEAAPNAASYTLFDRALNLYRKVG